VDAKLNVLYPVLTPSEGLRPELFERIGFFFYQFETDIEVKPNAATAKIISEIRWKFLDS
jgi:hypothetical protein